MTKRKYWSVLTPMPAQMLAMQAKAMEGAGLEGLFAPQVYGPPFIPMAAAAMVTERVRLASGIAIAFTRSPVETALSAIDIDNISGGRFTLGVGTSVKSWAEGIFGGTYGKPLEHLREVVEIVRLVNRGEHLQKRRYDGKYYQLDFSAMSATQPPLRPDIPIWVAALRGPLVRLAAEIADGVIGHYIWSTDWLQTRITDDLKLGLQRGGKQRSDVEFNAWLAVAINNNRADAINDARPTVAFYASVPQYEDYFAAHGYREEARRLQAAAAEGGYTAAAPLVPDDMAQTFVICGTTDEVRARVEPLWDTVDSLTLAPPAYALPPEKVMGYAMQIGAAFYG